MGRPVPILVLLATCSAPFPRPVAQAATVALTASRDNTLFQSAAGNLSNGTGPAIFAGLNGTGVVHRALLAFPVSDSVPAGAVIDSASLVLTVAQVSDPTARTMTLHRLAADWGEGESSTLSGGGAPAAPGDATWLHTFYPVSFWATPGGEFAPEVTAEAVVGGIGPYAWSGPGLTADVQAWLDEPATNHGWILLGEESAPGTARRFESRESSPDLVRPTLTIHYTATTTGTGWVGWGAVKARYR